MNRIISDNINQIRELCRSCDVRSLFAFGSVCTDRFNESSDIDLIVSFNPISFGDYADNFFYLADRFEELLGRSVDLITDKSLGNPYFIESVNRTKTKIYG